MGCMALLKSALPIRSAPANGTRGVLQLCYSLVSPDILQIDPIICSCARLI